MDLLLSFQCKLPPTKTVSSRDDLINFRAVNDFSTEALVARIIKIKATSSDTSDSVSISSLAKGYSLV
jgi:hypothetical protein